MGPSRLPPPVKLVLGLIYSSEQGVTSALGDLSERFGPVDLESGPFPFDFTTYYQKEMGSGLTRRFLSFSDLIPRVLLPDVKLITNSIEGELSSSGGRTVNLDPGYLSAENLILATTKGYSHRPYLRDGIYAELTYIYHKGTFNPLGWTYPDYKDSLIIDFFNTVRKKYMNQLTNKG